MTQLNTSDPTLDDLGVTVDEVNAARKTVCHYATGKADAVLLLAMLGLDGQVEKSGCKGCGKELALSALSKSGGRCKPCRTLVDVEPARNHLLSLRNAGHSLERISKAADVSTGILRNIVYGHAGHTSERTTGTASQRILAVSLEGLAAELVESRHRTCPDCRLEFESAQRFQRCPSCRGLAPVEQIQQHVRALNAAGRTYLEISALSGVALDTVKKLANGHPQYEWRHCSRRVAESIRAIQLPEEVSQ